MSDRCEHCGRMFQFCECDGRDYTAWIKKLETPDPDLQEIRRWQYGAKLALVLVIMVVTVALAMIAIVAHSAEPWEFPENCTLRLVNARQLAEMQRISLYDAQMYLTRRLSTASGKREKLVDPDHHRQPMKVCYK